MLTSPHAVMFRERIYASTFHLPEVCKFMRGNREDEVGELRSMRDPDMSAPVEDTRARRAIVEEVQQ
jgi:hypothetical protein